MKNKFISPHRKYHFLRTSFPILGLVLLSITTSCEKSEQQLNSNQSESDITIGYSLSGNDGKYAISCNGGCSCGFTTVGVGNWICDGCQECFIEVRHGDLRVEGIDAQNFIDSVLDGKDLLTDYFEDHITDKHENMNSHLITMLEVYVASTDNYGVLYEYVINDDFETLETVLIVYAAGGGGTVTKIDCSGGCDTQGSSCRERAYGNPLTFECTCAGSCAMTVTEGDVRVGE